MCLAQKGHAVNMGGKDMEVGGGERSGSPVSKGRAGQYYKKKALGTWDCSEGPEEALRHLSSQHVLSIWNCQVGILSPRNSILKLLGLELVEPPLKAMPQSFRQPK